MLSPMLSPIFILLLIMIFKLYFYILAIKKSIKNLEENNKNTKTIIEKLNKLINSNTKDIKLYSETCHNYSNILYSYIDNQNDNSKKLNELKNLIELTIKEVENIKKKYNEKIKFN
jgi:hypothetical protein